MGERAECRRTAEGAASCQIASRLTQAFNGLAASVRLTASCGSADDSNGYRRDTPYQLDRLRNAIRELPRR